MCIQKCDSTDKLILFQYEIIPQEMNFVEKIKEKISRNLALSMTLRLRTGHGNLTPAVNDLKADFT